VWWLTGASPQSQLQGNQQVRRESSLNGSAFHGTDVLLEPAQVELPEHFPDGASGVLGLDQLVAGSYVIVQST
jgi:hypothetical protein